MEKDVIERDRDLTAGDYPHRIIALAELFPDMWGTKGTETGEDIKKGKDSDTKKKKGRARAIFRMGSNTLRKRGERNSYCHILFTLIRTHTFFFPFTAEGTK